MNLQVWRRTHNTVGLEFTSASMKACAVSRKTDGGIVTMEHVNLVRDNGSDIQDDWKHERMEELAKFVKANRLQGSPAVMSVPNEQVVVRYMQLPDLPDKALRQAVEVELGTSIHLPFEDPVYDVLPVPCINRSELQPGYRTMCLIASPRNEVQGIVSIAREAGLHPVSVDISPLAVLRGTGTQTLDSNGLTCLIQVGKAGIVLSIFVGSAMYFFRSVEISATNDESANAATWVNDVAYELERVVNFFNYNLSDSERTVDRALLFALDCDGVSLSDALTGRLGREVTLLSAGAGIQCDSARWFIAAGLAMRGRDKT